MLPVAGFILPPPPPLRARGPGPARRSPIPQAVAPANPDPPRQPHRSRGVRPHAGGSAPAHGVCADTAPSRRPRSPGDPASRSRSLRGCRHRLTARPPGGPLPSAGHSPRPRSLRRRPPSKHHLRPSDVVPQAPALCPWSLQRGGSSVRPVHDWIPPARALGTSDTWESPLVLLSFKCHEDDGSRASSPYGPLGTRCCKLSPLNLISAETRRARGPKREAGGSGHSASVCTSVKWRVIAVPLSQGCSEDKLGDLWKVPGPQGGLTKSQLL